MSGCPLFTIGWYFGRHISIRAYAAACMGNFFQYYVNLVVMDQLPSSFYTVWNSHSLLHPNKIHHVDILPDVVPDWWL